jgi:chemotaxis family two-component system sensor kinase Cph1
MGEQRKAMKDKDRGRQPSGHGMSAVPGLRAAAEEKLARTQGGAPEDPAGKSAEKILHELQVHQIELEMQNEELKRTQVALEESRDKYLDLYDFAPVGYFTLTRAGQITEVNLAGAALLGLVRPKLVLRGLGRFVAPDDRDRLDQHLVSVLHSAEKQTCELTLKREDGSTFYVRLESIRLDRPAQEAGDGGPGQKIRVAMSDISDLKRAHGKLTEALAQLARSNKELESFAYSASHDLKGPLITITGFLGRLATDSEQGNVKGMHSDLARIGDATRKMDRLLHDLLELSRIGRVVGSLEAVSLAELAREVAKLLAGPIAEGRVRLEISPDLPTVRGERARLTQLLMNLLGNAVKFMGEQRDPQVKIGVRRDGEETVCYVRDNGIGIDPQHKDIIFGLFRQLDPSRGGTGIGLSVAKRVVETHGGRIWLESDGTGKGSTFCFTLAQRAGPVTEEEQENERFLPETLARVAG